MLNGRTNLNKAISDSDPDVFKNFKALQGRRPMRAIKDSTELSSGDADLAQPFVLRKGRNLLKFLLKDETQRGILEVTFNKFKADVKSGSETKHFQVINEEEKEINSAIHSKVKEVLPSTWAEMDTRSALEGEEVDDTAFNQLMGVWILANKEGSVSSGLEAGGFQSLRMQVQGGRLVALADARELCHYYRENSMEKVLDNFGKMNLDNCPDAWEVPSLSFEYLKTGDLLYTPPGFMIWEKFICDTSVALRTNLFYFTAPLADAFMAAMSQVASRPMSELMVMITEHHFPASEEPSPLLFNDGLEDFVQPTIALQAESLESTAVAVASPKASATAPFDHPDRQPKQAETSPSFPPTQAASPQEGNPMPAMQNAAAAAAHPETPATQMYGSEMPAAQAHAETKETGNSDDESKAKAAMEAHPEALQATHRYTDSEMTAADAETEEESKSKAAAKGKADAGAEGSLSSPKKSAPSPEDSEMPPADAGTPKGKMPPADERSLPSPKRSAPSLPSQSGADTKMHPEAEGRSPSPKKSATSAPKAKAKGRCAKAKAEAKAEAKHAARSKKPTDDDDDDDDEGQKDEKKKSKKDKKEDSGKDKKQKEKDAKQKKSKKDKKDAESDADKENGGKQKSLAF